MEEGPKVVSTNQGPKFVDDSRSTAMRWPDSRL